jgi:DNA-binding transcriptional regulator YhcF (GntR family)
MTARLDVTENLRDHIVGAMHVGQLRGGERLPSIREQARRLGRNERTVKAAYAALEEEGLVEVRGRSGVFVARQGTSGGDTSEEIARWMSAVVTEAWKRRIPLSGLPDLVQRLTRSQRVRCALVERVFDGAVALRHELEHEWGFEVRVVGPDALDDAGDVDFFVATSFYAAPLHAAVTALGKPLVVLTVHREMKDAIKLAIRKGSLAVVAVDPLFAERIRVGYAVDRPSRVRFVPAADSDAVARLDPDEPVLLTRAASERLGSVAIPMIFPHSPTISPETAHVLATLLVRKNATAE